MHDDELDSSFELRQYLTLYILVHLRVVKEGASISVNSFALKNVILCKIINNLFSCCTLNLFVFILFLLFVYVCSNFNE